MNTLRCRLAISLLVLAMPAWAADVPAQPAAPAPPSAAAASAAARPDEGGSDEDRDSDHEDQSDWQDHSERRVPIKRRGHHHGEGNDLVNIGHDTDLPAGARADSVVSILGSSTIEGEAGQAVSVLGNTRVVGPVAEDAVTVLGNTFVDSTVGGDVVAVLGNVELGPHAVVGHDVVAVGGTVIRDPASSIAGSVQSVGGYLPGFDWLHAWIEHCLFYGRPLAVAPGLGWAWGVALTFLALYLCIALILHEGVDRCVRTLETRPGATVLAALITVLFTPVLFVLLCITVVGIAAVPFVAVALFCASLFGKAVMLAWIGRRFLGARRDGPPAHTAAAVLIGGIVVLVLYLVPILGFVAYQLLGLFGLGAVVYTLIGAARERREAKNGTGPAPAFVAAATPAAAAAAAGSAAPYAEGADPAAAAAPAPEAPRSADPGITSALPRAGFWIRMVALFLDALLIGVLMGFMHHVFHLELVVLAAYGAIMWKLRGATIGGIVFDLQVVRQDGRPVDWETAIVRALGCFVSLVVAGLGFFWIAFDDGKQSWHDKIAGTVVVRVAKGVSLV
jgi:uncharacterized RDD family membrane protein YckC